MKIGFGLPNIGPLGSPDNIAQVADRAEALAYDSLWTIERLLWPVKPQTPYPVTPDGMLPEGYKYSLDPLDTLTFAAARTKRVALGTSVLDIPYYNPVMLGAPPDHHRHPFEWPPAPRIRPGLVERRNGRRQCRHETPRRPGR